MKTHTDKNIYITNKILKITHSTFIILKLSRFEEIINKNVSVLNLPKKHIVH